MGLDINFNLVRAQKLLFVPQLRQTLDILGMSSLELFQFIEEQLGINPFLETSSLQIPIADEQTNDNVYEAASKVSLKEHLTFQMDLCNLDKLQRTVGEYLIDNIDDNGYLKADICETAVFHGITSGRVLKVLELLQGCDPPGICARNLKECLTIQLKQMENNKDALEIVQKHLQRLAENDYERVSKEMSLSIERVQELFALIRSLEPRPGREFYKNTV